MDWLTGFGSCLDLNLTCLDYEILGSNTYLCTHIGFYHFD